MPKRCILGCPYDPSLIFHRFPSHQKHPDQFKTWVEIANGKLDSKLDYDHYSKKVICSRHFTKEDRNRNNRLNAMAIPTHYLPCESVDVAETEALDCSKSELLTQPSISTQVDLDTVKESAAAKSLLIEPPIATDMEIDWLDDEFLETDTFEQSASTEPLLDQTSTSTQIYTGTPFADSIKKEHNYTGNKKIKRTVSKPQIPKINEANRKSIQIMTKKIKMLTGKVDRLRKNNMLLRNKLNSVAKIRKEYILDEFIKNMTPAAKIFTKMQYIQTAKKARGRRFSAHEKILSLSIYNRSAKCYSLLSTYFAMPSTKNLKKLLAEIAANPPVKDSILNKELSPEDRMCLLILKKLKEKDVSSKPKDQISQDLNETKTVVLENYPLDMFILHDIE